MQHETVKAKPGELTLPTGTSPHPLPPFRSATGCQPHTDPEPPHNTPVDPPQKNILIPTKKRTRTFI